MTIGIFRRQVAKTMAPKPVKMALRTVAKNTARTQVAHAVVALKTDTGRLMQAMSQYLLGLQQSQAMKADAAYVLGDIGFDLVALSKVLKVKLPAATKKNKLTGTRGAGLLHLDGLATNLLRQVSQGLFVAPKMTTKSKIVANPHTGTKEERQVDVVDSEADAAADAVRMAELKSLVTEAVALYWRLCFDITGQAPDALLKAKFARMQAEFPTIAWAEPREAVSA